MHLVPCRVLCIVLIGVCLHVFTCHRVFCTTSRYALSDSKTITRFTVFFSVGVPRGWENAATLVTSFCLVAPLFPVAYPLVKGLEFVRRTAVRAVDGPSRGAAEEEEEELPPGYIWCFALIIVQNIGTLMTLTHSVYAAVLLRDEILSEAFAAPAASLFFGIYYLWITFPKRRGESTETGNFEEESFEHRMENQAFADKEIMGVVRSRKFWLSIPAAAVGLAVLTLPFVGVYVMRTAASLESLGYVLAVIGFVLLGLLCCLALKGPSKNIGARLAFLLSVPAMIVAGMGIVNYITQGYSEANANMIAGGTLILLFSVPCGVREYFFSTAAALQAQQEGEQAAFEALYDEIQASREERDQAKKEQRRQREEEKEQRAEDTERQERKEEQEGETAKWVERAIQAMEEAMNFPQRLVSDFESSKIENETSEKEAVEASDAHANVWADACKHYAEGVGYQGGEPSAEGSTASVLRASTGASKIRTEGEGGQTPAKAMEASAAAMAAMMQASTNVAESTGNQVPEKAMESSMAALAAMIRASKNVAESIGDQPPETNKTLEASMAAMAAMAAIVEASKNTQKG